MCIVHTIFIAIELMSYIYALKQNGYSLSDCFMDGTARDAPTSTELSFQIDFFDHIMKAFLYFIAQKLQISSYSCR